MVWSCRGALSMRQHHAAARKKSTNRLQVPALQSGRQIGDQRSYSLRTQAALKAKPRLVGWLALILLAQGSFRLLAAGAFGDRQIRFYSHKEADNPVCLPAAGLRPNLN